MKRDFLRLRSSLVLVGRKTAKLSIFSGPVVTPIGTCYSRPFDFELLEVDRDARDILWRVSTKTGPLQFRPWNSLPDRRIAGTGTASGVAVYDAEDGTLLWSRPDLAGVWWRDGMLVSTKDAAALVELEPTTGDILRTLAAAGEGLTIMNGSGAEVIFCSKTTHEGTEDTEVRSRTYRCVKAETGEVLWERDVAAEVWRASKGRAPRSITYLIPGSLGESWIGRCHDDTFACSRADGSLRWVAPYRCGSVATVHDGRVFGMEDGGVFHVLDERTGQLLSRYDGAGIEGAMFPRPAAMLGPYAVYGTESGHVVVFDPRDGRLVWSKRHKSGTPNVGVVDGRVYVTTERGELLVYEPTIPIE